MSLFKKEVGNIIRSCARYSFHIDKDGKLKTDQDELEELISYLCDKIEGTLKEAYTVGFSTGSEFTKSAIAGDLSMAQRLDAGAINWHARDFFDKWISSVEDHVRPIVKLD